VRRFFPLLLLLSVAAAPQTPAPGPVRVIGGHGGGCIAGAVRLPDAAPGLQTIRRSHSAFWGHPDTIAAKRTTPGCRTCTWATSPTRAAGRWLAGT
jgi:murein endopeptidase